MLGAILAGGRSTRFGSDKAIASIEGKPLLAHVAEALAPQVETLVVCGRDWPGLTGIPDFPRADLGPLGGLAAALVHAAEHGFSHVLSAGCDVLPVPPDLVARLTPAPAVLAEQRLFGLWPSSLAAQLARHLEGGDRSLRGWIAASAARTIVTGLAFHNINQVTDLNGFDR